MNSGGPRGTEAKLSYFQSPSHLSNGFAACVQHESVSGRPVKEWLVHDAVKLVFQLRLDGKG